MSNEDSNHDGINNDGLQHDGINIERFNHDKIHNDRNRSGSIKIDLCKISSSLSFMRRDKRSPSHICSNIQEMGNNAANSCIYCHVEFESLVKWHAHMVSFTHRGPLLTPLEAAEKHIETEIVCKFCKQDIIIGTVKEHRCCIAEEKRLAELIENYNVAYCPLICILCKNVRVFKSQSALQIHLVTKHSPMKDPLRCSLCNARFKTKDLNVHEVHARDLHEPELDFLYWQLGQHMINPKTKQDGVKYVCALNYYSSKQKETNVCNDVLTDVFQLTLHTLCHHGFVTPRNVLQRISVQEESGSSNFKAFTDICRYCGFPISSAVHLANHIIASHSLELLLRRDFIVKKKLFYGKIPLHLMCLTCPFIFDNVDELQVSFFYSWLVIYWRRP